MTLQLVVEPVYSHSFLLWLDSVGFLYISRMRNLMLYDRVLRDLIAFS